MGQHGATSCHRLLARSLGRVDEPQAFIKGDFRMCTHTMVQSEGGCDKPDRLGLNSRRQRRGD